MFSVLQNELETAMKLVGITDVSQAHPGLLNTKEIDHLISTPNMNSGREMKL
jgi:L-lactate dehydrogenase (cytochrome)